MRTVNVSGWCALRSTKFDMPISVPEHWIKFRAALDLTNHDADIPEEHDLSEVGAEIEFFTDEAIISEVEGAYPGCVVYEDGFLPIGGCQIGTGDPYFINLNEGENSPLYRIYHDEVLDSTYTKEAAIDVVLPSYKLLNNFIQTP